MTEFFIYLLKSGICLGLFYGLYWFFLKKETYFMINRVYLIFSIILAFFLPLIHLTSPFFTEEVPSASELLVVSNSLSRGVPIWLILLSVIYFIGIVVLLNRFIIRLSSLLKLIRKYGIRSRDGIKIVQLNGDFSPFSFFNSIFLNHIDANDLNLEEIIAHERVHIRQYHSLDLMVLEVLSIFHWFNPFVWPYKKSLKETHEYLADQGVIAQGFSPAKYQMLIFEHHVGVKLFEFANNFDRSQIKRRITMMTKIKSKNWSKIKVLLVVPAFLFLVIAFANSKPADMSDPVIGYVESGGTSQALSDAAFISQDEQKEKKVDKKENLTEKEKQMIEELKIKYEKTDDPELKKKIKEKLTAILAGKTAEKPNQDELSEKEKKLKMILEKTEDPKEREKINLELKKIQTLKEELKVKQTKAKDVKEKELKSKEEAKEKEKKK